MVQFLIIFVVFLFSFQTVVLGEVGKISKSKELCRKFSRELCESSQNGPDAETSKYKYAVLVGYTDKDHLEIQWSCGGSLVSESYVMTAATCALDRGEGETLWVRISDYDILSREDDVEGKSKAENYKVAQKFIHPGYKVEQDFPYDYSHDIALLKLKKAVAFNNFVRPICLQSEHNLGQTHAQVASWNLDRRAQNGKIIQRNVTLIAHEDCQKTHKSAIEDGRLICALDLEPAEACQSGDSGSALIIPNPDSSCIPVQIGLVSFAAVKGSYPNCIPEIPIVYTRISYYLEWIETTIFQRHEERKGLLSKGIMFI